MDTLFWVLSLLSLYPTVQYAYPLRQFSRWPKVYSSTETSSMFPRAEDHANGSSMDHPDGEIGEDGHYHKCVICDDGGDLLCCDTCPGVYHLQCLDPPLEHVPAGSWQCQRCCQKDVMDWPAKSLKSWRRPDSSDNTMEELDAAEVLANKMSISRSCDKNLPDKGLGTDIIQSRRWKDKYFRRSGVKRRRSDISGLFNSSSTQTGSDKQVDAFLKKDVPCSDRQQEEKAADMDSDGLIDAPQALETVQNVVSRRNHLVDVWPEEELDALRVGVRRYGPGNWQMMLEDSILKFSTSKTPQDLSLRWEIERQWILNSESFQASPYEVSITRGVLKIYYEARKPSASSSSKTNDSNPAAESEPSLKDWCTKEEGCSEETVSNGGDKDKLTD